MGLPRERRLRKRADFVRVQAVGRRVTTPHFVLLVARSSEAADAPARLGLVVTRKIGVAVVRNRIKRVCRACFRAWPAPPGLVPPGVDLVVIARMGAGELGLAAVREEWSRVTGQLVRRAKEVIAQA